MIWGKVVTCVWIDKYHIQLKVDTSEASPKSTTKCFEIVGNSDEQSFLKKCSQSDRIGPNIPLISTIIFKASKK